MEFRAFHRSSLVAPLVLHSNLFSLLPCLPCLLLSPQAGPASSCEGLAAAYLCATLRLHPALGQRKQVLLGFDV